MAGIPELTKLSLMDNPVCKVEGYAQKVFEMIPSLLILDEKDKDGKDAPLSDGSDWNAEEGEAEVNEDIIG